MKIRYQVITQTPPSTTGGNMASALIDVYRQVEQPRPSNGYSGVFRQELDLSLYRPVFHVGEVLIVNLDGREIAYPQRKASKWDVGYEMFDELEPALERAREVYERDLALG